MTDIYKRQLILMKEVVDYIENTFKSEPQYFQRMINNIESLNDIIYEYNKNLYRQIYNFWADLETINAIRLENLNNQFLNFDDSKISEIKYNIDNIRSLVNTEINKIDNETDNII